MAAWLADRGISITVDDIGRASVSRSDGRKLLTEQRENQVRAREVAARQERQAIELDQQRRAQLWGGIPAYAIPPGVSAAAAMVAAAHDARPRRVTPLQEALAGESLTFHPIRSDGDES